MAFVLGNSKCHGLSGWPYQVLFSTWALPAQPCALRRGKCWMYEARVPYWVLFSTWAVPVQPYSRHEKRHWRSRAHRSTITRLPSGASVSRSTSFRSGAFGVGAGTAHRCTRRVGGTLSYPRSARAVSFGVRLGIRAHMRAHGLGRNTFPQALRPPLRPSAQSRLSQRLRPRG